jgi:hypothetical protein
MSGTQETRLLLTMLIGWLEQRPPHEWVSVEQLRRALETAREGLAIYDKSLEDD